MPTQSLLWHGLLISFCWLEGECCPITDIPPQLMTRFFDINMLLQHRLQCNTIGSFKGNGFQIVISNFSHQRKSCLFLKGTLFPIPIWLHFPMKRSTRDSVVQTSWKTNFKHFNKWQTRLHQFSIANKPKTFSRETEKSITGSYFRILRPHLPYLNLSHFSIKISASSKAWFSTKHD